MSDAMQYGFHVGQRLASHNVKTAVNLGGLVAGINKAVRGVTGAADTASTAKPAVAAATSRVPPTTGPKITISPQEVAGAAAPKMTTIGPGSFAAPAVNQARAAAAANPHAHQFGQPLKMAPPAGSAPAVRPTAPPPPPPPAPTAGKVTVSPAEAAAGRAAIKITPAEAAAGRAAVKITPQEAAAAPTNTQGAQMFFDNAQSGGRQQMLGYGQRGAPSNLPQKWEQLSPEQQATVMKTLGY